MFLRTGVRNTVGTGVGTDMSAHVQTCPDMSGSDSEVRSGGYWDLEEM